MDNTETKKFKTCLSNRGYIIRKSHFTNKELETIRDDLTVKPNFCPGYQSVEPETFKLYSENENKLYIPRYYGQEKFGIADINKQLEPESINIKLTAKLRPIQEPIIEKYLISAEETGGGIISAACGVGKTFMSLYLISRFQVKSLILVHKEFLMNQWRERIKEFLPDAKIGIIQGPKSDVVDKDIVIGMIQSISLREYPDYIFKGFGFIISDECHHMAARSFCKAFKKTVFKYSLGLSATPKRKDGLSRVFKWNLGDIVFKSDKVKESNVLVYMYKYINNDSKYSKTVLNIRQKANNTSMITNIANCIKRNKFIVSLLPDLVKNNRKILILTERLSQVDWLLKNIKELDDISCGKYVGGIKQSKLDEALEKKVIVGTYTMIEEGFDCKELNTLIMATPKIDIEQSVGRILRKKAEDRIIAPLIIDVWDVFSTYQFKGIQRIKYYKNRNYKITYFDVDDNSNITQILEQIKTKSKNTSKNNNSSSILIDDEIDSDDETSINNKNKNNKNIDYVF